MEDPPPAVAALLKQVREGTPLARVTAAKALGQLREAEPYLRLASMLADADPDTRPRLKAALTAHHIAIDARNVERAKKWADDGRIDMLVEAICFARWDASADAMTQLLFKFAETCSDRATKLLKLKEGEEFPRLGPIQTFEEMVEEASTKKPDGTAKRPTVRRHSRGTDDPVQLSGNAAQSALIRAEQVESRAGLGGSVAVVRDQWTAPRFTKGLDRSLLFINADIELDDLDRCLVVTDGDVTRWEAGRNAVRQSVVIACGSIQGRDVGKIGSSASCLWAGRNITLPTSDEMRNWAVLAGGKISVWASERNAPAVLERDDREPVRRAVL